MGGTSWSRARQRRWGARAQRAFALVVCGYLVLLLAGCGGSAGSSDGGSAGSGDGGRTAGIPGGQGSRSLDLDEFKQRCVEAARSSVVARLVYQSVVDVRVGSDTRYSITLQSPGAGVPSGAHSTKLGVTCYVQVRLEAPDSRLEVSPSGLQTQPYLPPTPTRFSWIVAARSPGHLLATLELQPVVRIKTHGEVRPFELQQVPVGVTFDATAAPTPAVPTPSPHPSRHATHSTQSLLDHAWAVVVSFATGVAAIAGAITAVVGLRRRKERQEASASPPVREDRGDPAGKG